MTLDALPVAIIGAGPVGLAAAAHLVSRGETPIVLEAGPAVGATVRQWGHVRVFSPWRYNVDSEARAMLDHDHHRRDLTAVRILAFTSHG